MDKKRLTEESEHTLSGDCMRACNCGCVLTSLSVFDTYSCGWWWWEVQSVTFDGTFFSLGWNKKVEVETKIQIEFVKAVR
ncbi:hypothetical protein HN873_002361, partial [Arachis hypogaea]